MATKQSTISPAVKQIDKLLSTIHSAPIKIKISPAPAPHQRKKKKKRRNNPDPRTVKSFDYRNQLIVAAQYVLSKVGSAPIALVLGSGLGGFSSKLVDKKELPYEQIPFLPLPTVKGHSGKIIMGYLVSSDKQTKKRIMCFSGRLHSYEGYPMFQVVFCARLAYLCGVHTLILTNAGGGCVKDQQAGSVVILDDYIRDVNYKVLAHSAHDEMFGVRHLRADKLLNKYVTNILLKAAKQTKFPHYYGTYWWCMGPCYETASQVRFSIKTGASCIGMSTVPSILAAKNIGLRVAAMSLCTNVAAGLADEELNHDIVVQGAKAAQKGFGNFVQNALLQIDNPDNYNAYQYDNNIGTDLKLNLNNLSMNINSNSIDELIYKRKFIGTFNDLYKDIAYIRSFLANILDLDIDTTNSTNITPIPQSSSVTSAMSATNVNTVNTSDVKDNNDNTTDPNPNPNPLLQSDNLGSSPGPKKKHFQAPIDFTSIKPGGFGLVHSSSLSVSTQHLYHNIDGSISSSSHRIQNRDGPIPIWILHDPFQFDITTLTCPVTIPLRSLWGFDKISTSTSARNAIICFGFDQFYNFMVVLCKLELEGFSFDECNYVINVLYGVLGHKNLYFTNMFYAFPTKTLYSDDQKDDQQNNGLTRQQYALIKDSVDFIGGIPRFPFPLFPPKEINTNDCYVRMKYGVFGNTKTTDSQVECLKGFRRFFDDMNTNKKTEIYSYSYWPGPNLPTLAEAHISSMAGCELIGISNPFMTPMSRQLGHDGYSVAYIPSIEEFKQLTGSKPKQLVKDVTSIVYTISSSIISFFKSSASLFSPASMNRFRPSIFKASTITDRRLKQELSKLNIPYNTPQHQVLHTIDDEWAFVTKAAEWLSNVWNFDDHPITNALFSSFSHVIDHTLTKITKRGLVSIDLSNIPGWKEHFCGGYPYSHYHWDNDNPFEWTLKIFKYEPKSAGNTINNNTAVLGTNYYIVVAPHFFTNSKLHPQRYAYMTSFYKYTPRFWNLSFIVRVLWKLGVENICFLSHLISNNCSAHNDYNTLAKNNVVVMNNYLECARWNILTGPNDDRMGPRFIPITEPIELEDDFLNIVQSSLFNKNIPSVITVHIPSSATISPTTSSFYGKLGYHTRVLGLIPCIQTAQHLGLKKVCVGITDYTIDEKLQNVESFDEILKMIETMFANLEKR